MSEIQNDEKKSQQEYLESMDVPPFYEYTYYQFLQDRQIILNEQITPFIVERVIMQILKFNEEDKNTSIEQRKPITIYIHSGGGDVMSGLVLLDIIQQSKTPVYTVALGLAGSMAGLILMAGHVRLAYKKSIILIHDGSLSLSSSNKKAKQIMEFYDEMDSKIRDFVINRTKICPELYDEKHGEEWFMFADKALELGVIDQII